MDQVLKRFQFLPGSVLKYIAILTMLIDHTGATVIREIVRRYSLLSDRAHYDLWAQIYSLSRSVGRLAFPIFCFLIVEGFVHTRNPRKYAIRLFLFSLISEIPFDRALKGAWFFPEKQNVYFTLLIGLLVLIGVSYFRDIPWAAAACAAAGMYAAHLLNTDYGFKGVFLILVLYLFRSYRFYQGIAGACACTWEMPAPAAFLPVLFYNGKRGRQMKYFFYLFYPVHLMLLYFVKIWALPALIH